MSNTIRVTLDGDAGTIAAMEWLRNHIEETVFKGHAFMYDKYGRLKFIVSETSAPFFININDGVEINGMIRYGNPRDGWYIKINERVFYMSYEG